MTPASTTFRHTASALTSIETHAARAQTRGAGPEQLALIFAMKQPVVKFFSHYASAAMRQGNLGKLPCLSSHFSSVRNVRFIKFVKSIRFGNVSLI